MGSRHLLALIGISLLSVTCVYQGLSTFNALVLAFPTEEGMITLPYYNITDATKQKYGLIKHLRTKILSNEFFLPNDSSSADEPAPVEESEQESKPEGSRPTVHYDEFFLRDDSSSGDEDETTPTEEKVPVKEKRGLKEYRPPVRHDEFFLPQESSSVDEETSSTIAEASSIQDLRVLEKSNLPLALGKGVVVDSDASKPTPKMAGSTKGQSTDITEPRPTLVLHIGPHKTATSTIQCELTHYQTFLQKHGNYTYLGRQYDECKSSSKSRYDYDFDSRALVRCLDRHSKEKPCQETSVWKSFEEALFTLAQNQQNVILSDEAFSRLKLTNKKTLDLLLAKLQEHFHLRVVLYYRHYHSWFLSQYNEHFKPLTRRAFLQKWPGEGGKRIRPFAEYYTQYQQEVGIGKPFETAAAKGNYQLAADRLNIHPVVYLQNQWSDAKLTSPAKDFRVVNMHNDEGGVTYQFLAQAVSPELAGLYRKHVENTKGDTNMPLRKNPSLDLDFDMLSVEAREEGLFPKDERLERRRVAYFTERVLQKNATSLAALPEICLDKDHLQHFLNHSLAMEQTVFWDDAIRSQLEQDFQQAVDSSKFCNMDTKKALSYDQVQKTFKSLVAIVSSNRGA